MFSKQSERHLKDEDHPVPTRFVNPCGTAFILTGSAFRDQYFQAATEQDPWKSF